MADIAELTKVAEKTALTPLLLYSRPLEAKKVLQVHDNQGHQPIAFQEIKDSHGKGTMLYASRVHMPGFAGGGVQNYAQTENIELYNGNNINVFDRRNDKGAYLNSKGALDITIGFPGNDMGFYDLARGIPIVSGADMSKDHESIRNAMPKIMERMMQRAETAHAKGVNINIMANSIGAINSVIALDWLRDYQRAHPAARLTIEGLYNVESVGAGQALQDAALYRATMDNHGAKPSKDQVAAAAKWIVGDNFYSLDDNNTFFHGEGADDTYANRRPGKNIEILSPDTGIGFTDLMTDHQVSNAPNQIYERGVKALRYRPDFDLPADKIALGGEPLDFIDQGWARLKAHGFVTLMSVTMAPLKLLAGDRSLADRFNEKASFEFSGNHPFDFTALDKNPAAQAESQREPARPAATPAQRTAPF